MGDHLAISGGSFTGPLEPSQNMFRGGRQVFQVGQAPSSPTAIRLLSMQTKAPMLLSFTKVTSCAEPAPCHDPPLSYPCGCQSASPRRADRAYRPQCISRFPRSIARAYVPTVTAAAG